MTLAVDVLVPEGQLRHVKSALIEVKSVRFIVGTQTPTVTER
jgi:hypothetical protein